MAVEVCYLCEKNPTEARHLGGTGLARGRICPLCHRPTCGHHLVTVRWRWKKDHHLEETEICRECRRTYEHRGWDTLHRDWIS